jgi:aldehyde dehydrogenase (NAD+)
LKAAEDAPGTAWIFGEIAHKAGLPSGVLNIIQGYGEEAGAPLVDHEDVGVISFTGSTEVGRQIQLKAGRRLAKISLELGGKNALIVCEDANLDNAAKWVLLSAFSNAGQRCASGSRIIIIESIYEKFKNLLIDKTSELNIGNTNDDDFGPVINEKQLNNMLSLINKARDQGVNILYGGKRLTDKKHKNGFYLSPTLIEKVDPDSELSKCELFGPITCLYRVNDYKSALDLANNSPYGLTGCIHTNNFDRANHFIHHLQAGVAVVNAGTFGSEPHMPFGGVKQSGNGTREPGTEAIDIYSDLKDVYINISTEVN